LGYFQTLAQAPFRTGSEGQILFHRYGMFGKPFVVPSEARRDEIQAFIANYYRIAIPLSIVAGVALKFQALLGAPLLILWYSIGIARHTKGLARSDEKLSLGQSQQEMGRSLHPAFLWTGLAASLFFVLGALFMLILGDQVKMPLLSIAFFGTCAWGYARMLRLRKKP